MSDQNKDQNVERLLSPAEVATRMGRKVSIVLAWIASKQLLAINTAQQIGPGHRPRWRIRTADLQAFEEARSNAPRETIEKAPRRSQPRPKLSGEEFV